MQNALGLMMDQTVMFAIILALGAAGLLGLFLALYWPPRWQLHYRVEVFFAALLVGLGVYADARSAATFLKAETESGDLVFVIGSDQPLQQYYWPELRHGDDGVIKGDVWDWSDKSRTEQFRLFEALISDRREVHVHAREVDLDHDAHGQGLIVLTPEQKIGHAGRLARDGGQSGREHLHVGNFGVDERGALDWPGRVDQV